MVVVQGVLVRQAPTALAAAVVVAGPTLTGFFWRLKLATQ